MTIVRFFVRGVAFIAVLFIAACDSTEPDQGGAGEQELITRVTITLTSAARTVVATASDPDGSGTQFEIGTLTLSAGTTYDGTISVFDDVNGENVGDEVEEEAEEHQFFYTPGGGVASRVAVLVTDRDANELPVGLTFRLTVSDGGPAAGTLNVALAHFDEEPKDGVNRGGETDIDLTFPVTIE